MPHYDGQSPGNEWVKTASGWKKLVALRENLHRQFKKLARERFQSSCKDSSSGEGTSSYFSNNNTQQGNVTEEWAPGQTCDAVLKQAQNARLEYQNLDKPQASFVVIPRSAGARGIYFTVGELLCKLDFASAVGDCRRYNYVCRLLELIVTTRFSSLSGLAQKNLLGVIEEALQIVLKTHENIAQMRRILTTAITAMNSGRFNHIGCLATWKVRANLLQGWLETLNSIEVTEREDDGCMMMTDLPDELLHRILTHLSDHRDIVNTGQTCDRINILATQNKLWRDLCHFHFTDYQIKNLHIDCHCEPDGKTVYRKLYKRHPVHEEYTDMLQICAYCNCLFWMNGGHPCTKELLPEGDTSLEERPELSLNTSLTPQQFLDLFPAPR